jgi:uncharacterized protein (TIGR03437 family)
MNVAIAQFAPYVFTVNQQGKGQAAALIVGTSSLPAPAGAFPGSRPVQQGEYISLFATGLGLVQNQPADGSSSTGLSPTVQNVFVNFSTTYPTPYFYLYQAVPAQFSGLAPGFVGLYQVNVQVPASAAVGDAVSLQISNNPPTGLIGSNAVTIAIQKAVTTAAKTPADSKKPQP